MMPNRRCGVPLAYLAIRPGRGRTPIGESRCNAQGADSCKACIAGQQGPTSSRLQRVEAALAAESAARDRAERALHDTQTALQALQTKIGHNELAKNEAVAAARRDREELVSLREEIAAGAERSIELQERAEEAESELRALRTELSEERRARKLAERLLTEAQQDAGSAPALPRYVAPPREEIERIPARRGRPPLVRVEAVDDAEPVKWWLTPAKAAAKRR